MTEETIFAAALEKAATERHTFLESACAGDAALRVRIESLLRSLEEAGTFLDVPIPDQISPPGDRPSRDDDPLHFLGSSRRLGSLGRLDHFKILELIGQGGMGVVLKAFDEKLERIVAIKVLAPQLATSGSARRRFVREARAAARISHPHVVSIHSVEEDEKFPYIVMQFIDGMSLQECIDRDGPLSLKEIVRTGTQMAWGLAAAHKEGLIHRDIKPSNILLEHGIRRVKITDFGLARAADDASRTQSVVIAGTPMFMSPEQAAGDQLEYRSDLFSLGSVLYTMCAGQPPFRAATAMGVLRRVCEETPRSIREINPEIPEWLEAIVAKLLAKEPSERFQSAAELAELLGQHHAGLQQSSWFQPVKPGSSGRRRQRWKSAAILGTVLAAIIGIVVWQAMR